jgi:hypothetical protein
MANQDEHSDRQPDDPIRDEDGGDQYDQDHPPQKPPSRCRPHRYQDISSQEIHARSPPSCAAPTTAVGTACSAPEYEVIPGLIRTITRRMTVPQSALVRTRIECENARPARRNASRNSAAISSEPRSQAENLKHCRIVSHHDRLIIHRYSGNLRLALTPILVWKS